MFIYIGCTIKPVDNWQALLPMPQAPSNWKDQKKITAYVQEKIADLANGKAAQQPLTGAVDRWALMRGIDGKIIEGEGGLALLDQLNEIFIDNNDVVCGYKIYRNLKFAMVEHCAERGPLPEKLMWIYDQRSYGTHMIGMRYFDPVSAMFGTSDEEKTDIHGVCGRLKVEAELSTPSGLVQFARDLALKLYPN